MKYDKPEIVLLGSATRVVQGKLDPYEVDPPTDNTIESAYDLDD